MKYKKQYGNKTKQKAYINACDCLYNGYSKEQWNNCGISEAEAVEIWAVAFRDITSVY